MDLFFSRSFFAGLFLSFANLCFSQGLRPETISLQLGFGTSDHSKDTNVYFMQESYPDLSEFQIDLHGFENTEHRVAFLRQGGFSSGITFAIRDSLKKRSRNPILKLDLGGSLETILSGDHQKKTFNGTTPGVVDTLNRQSLRWSLSAKQFYMGVTVLFYTHYLGEVCRFYGGMGYQLGFSKQFVTVDYKNETYRAMDTTGAGEYKLIGSPIYSRKTEQEYKLSPGMTNSRVQFPIGIEMSSPDHLWMAFLELKFGYTTYHAPNLKGLEGSSVFVGFGIRRSIYKPSKRK